MEQTILISFTTILTCGLLIFLYFQYCKHTISQSIIKNSGDYVVLLHGLGRTSFSMQKIGRQLTKNNYRVINISYPSRKAEIETLAKETLKKELLKQCTDRDKKINFVTHSMGGIVARYFLKNYPLKKFNQLIMLTPPSKGSEAADKWSKNKIINFIMGPALIELTTSKDSFVNLLSLPNYEFGIIAGKYDKKISIEKTKLSNMKNFIITKNGHSEIMYDKKVISNILYFLAEGKFKNSSAREQL